MSWKSNATSISNYTNTNIVKYVQWGDGIKYNRNIIVDFFNFWMQKNVEQRKVEQILPNASSCMANDLWQGEKHNITIHILCDGSKEGPRVGMMMLCNNVRIALYLLDICCRIIRWWNQFDHSTSLKYGWVAIKLTNPLVIWCPKHFCQLFLVHKQKRYLFLWPPWLNNNIHNLGTLEDRYLYILDRFA
jgi:hypothetical protein